ncbi:hypothetical protein [Nakamurella deserti]|uniref:hypothetical protein n=1 Tax=Nakamurella deserti TaxID=2164074 RepID=UPI0013006D7F|nr:hypothetical protein [Nakamurella deserti]
MRSFGGRTFDPPVRLAFDEAQLRAHLARTADAARSVHPEVTDPLERAFLLFTVQLDAHLRSEAGPGSEVGLRDGVLRVRPVQRPVSGFDDLPPGRKDGPLDGARERRQSPAAPWVPDGPRSLGSTPITASRREQCQRHLPDCPAPGGSAHAATMCTQYR